MLGFFKDELHMKRSPRFLHGWALLLCIASFVHSAITPAAELRIGLSGEVTSLDPHFLAAQPNLTVARHVFESLTDVDPQTRLIPGLAERWRPLDALNWEFNLRRGVKFHDGTELTAEDVAFSLQRPLSIKGSPGGFASFVRAVESTAVVDKSHAASEDKISLWRAA